MDDAFLLQSSMARATLVFETNSPTDEASPTEPSPILPDIHDENREKIVIRPRCKEYVQKQRTLPTLSCFSATPQKEEIPDEPKPQLYVVLGEAGVAGPSNADAAKVSQLPKSGASKKASSSKANLKAKLGVAKKAAPTTTHFPFMSGEVMPKNLAVAKKATLTKPHHALPSAPRALREPSFKPRAVVSSGRIEKPPRSPPRSPPRTVQPPYFPMDATAVVATVARLYHCCSTPSGCPRCKLWRLFDEFCGTIAERREKIRQNQTSAMYS
ncbi:hypothetical protein C8F04DRAFT_1388504 [Mycena alexandri]|uniref:Uncharacterized protein n=1 Tax=Mycena alexandri TaxID=1745969 RepID=A0AAD6XDH2_9AGAR|nr:hypothetical protein C8F04DRAFT_1388504 [Mycena alexandri]